MAQTVQQAPRSLSGADVAAQLLSDGLDEVVQRLKTPVRQSLARALDLPATNQGSGQNDGYSVAAKRGLLVVATAILFHHRVQDHLPTQSPVGFDGDWPPASATACAEQDTAINAYREAWRAILAVDYRPVFETGRAALAALPADPDTGQAVRHLAEVVARVSERVSGLRHDLLGRIFHRVLDTARYDGSFYTSTAAAVLLASLAIREQDADWSDPNSVAALRICDPACGTGTLLGVFNGIPYLGSLDFLSGQAMLAAWPSATQQVESQQGTAEPPPPMDLVIMNPPFTRDSLRHDQLSSRVKLNSRRQTESQGMTMTTDKEQEAFSLAVERHKNGSSENSGMP